MTSHTGKAVLLTVACAAAIFFLYFFRLDAMGLIGPDEPRYAAIGREMAHSGDWITPRLWGTPWFEKPALIYWLTGAGNLFGLNADLAPRVPVALVSSAFLVFFFFRLKREWGSKPAFYSSAILASSAAWVAFSQSGVTDLPLAATFGGALFLALPWIDRGERRNLPFAAALLGLAVLAKGLVPLVLVLPVFWFARRRWRDLFYPPVLLAFAATALPWYVLCTLRNGTPFLTTFFLEHQLGRFSSEALQHVQPFWFYGPVLLASFFPWTALLALLLSRSLYLERHTRVLAAVALWGFIFFSVSTNKLGGYLLPLMPSVAALTGLGLFRARFAAPWLLLPALSLAWVPVIGALLPVAIASGLGRAWPVPLIVRFRAALLMLPLMMAGATALLVERVNKRHWAVAGLFALTVGSVIWLKVTSLPVIDREASARALYLKARSTHSDFCTGTMPRAWPYALNYYFDRTIPPCNPLDPIPSRVVLSH